MTIRSDNNDKYAQPDGVWIGARGTPTNVTLRRPGAEGRRERRARPASTTARPRSAPQAFEQTLPLHHRPRAGHAGDRAGGARSCSTASSAASGSTTGRAASRPTCRWSARRSRSTPPTPATGERRGAAVHRKTIGADGRWGPFAADAPATYEFVIAAPGYATTHVYRSPFPRSSSIVSLRAERLADADRDAAVARRADAAARLLRRAARPHRPRRQPARRRASRPASPACRRPRLKLADGAGRAVVGEFNGERIVGRAWPVGRQPRRRARAAPTELTPASQLLFSQGFGSRRECAGADRRRRCRDRRPVVDDPHEESTPTGLVFSVRGEAWTYRERRRAGDEQAGRLRVLAEAASHHPSVYSLLPAAAAPARRAGDRPARRGHHRRAAVHRRRHADPPPDVAEAPRAEGLRGDAASTRSTRAQLERLLDGVVLHDDPAPVRAAACEATGESTLRLTLTEGKYHQVKRMVAAAGNRVEALHRSAFGAARRRPGPGRVAMGRRGARALMVSKPAPRQRWLACGPRVAGDRVAAAGTRRRPGAARRSRGRGVPRPACCRPSRRRRGHRPAGRGQGRARGARRPRPHAAARRDLRAPARRRSAPWPEPAPTCRRSRTIATTR